MRLKFKNWKYDDWENVFKIVVIKYDYCDNILCKYHLKLRKDGWYHLHHRVNNLPKKFDKYEVLDVDYMYDQKWLKEWVYGVILKGKCCE